MFEFGIIKKHRIKKKASFFELLDLYEHNDLEKLKAIINVFELDIILLKCVIRVPVDSKLLNLSNMVESVVVNITKTKKYLLSKKMHSDVEIEFYGEILPTILDIAADEGEALYIIPKDITNNDIELILNDNDHNYINFSMGKYDVKEIERKVKLILKQHK